MSSDENLIIAVADALLDAPGYRHDENACTRIELARADAKTLLECQAITQLLDVCTEAEHARDDMAMLIADSLDPGAQVLATYWRLDGALAKLGRPHPPRWAALPKK